MLLFIGVFLLLCYYFKIKTRATPLRLLGCLILSLIVWFVLKKLLLQQSFRQLEQADGFQDKITTLEPIVNQALVEGGKSNNVLKGILNKYQSLVKRFNDMLTNTSLEKTQYENRITDLQKKLNTVAQEYKDYKTKIRTKLPDSIRENYVPRSQVLKLIDTKCDFTKYDITKHPKFQERCITDPNAYPIQQHRDYDAEIKRAQSEQEAKLFQSLKMKDSKFGVACRALCADPQFYPQRGLNDYDVTQHNRFGTECLNRCRDPNFFPELQKTKKSQSELLQEKQSLLKRTKELQDRNKSLGEENTDLKKNLQNQLQSFQIHTVQDCPNLELLLKTLKENA